MCSQWLDIDTAPKDGTPVDVWVRVVLKGKAGNLALRGHRVTWARWQEGDGWIRFDEDGGVDLLEIEDIGTIEMVTHWMPVPEPPELDK